VSIAIALNFFASLCDRVNLLRIDDICNRLGKPGGVGWKDVNAGRLRRTTSGKRSILWLRAARKTSAESACSRRPVPRLDHLQPNASNRQLSAQPRLPKT
jgi:hypothetical protein